MITDVLKWFLIFFLGLFLVWVFSGGPKRAEQKNLTPIIGGPTGVGGQISTPSVQNSSNQN
jgi:hypothetical protein